MNDLDRRLSAAIKAKTSKGGDWNKLLESEAHRLYNLIQMHIVGYYSHYLPKQYKETNNFMNSLRIKTSNDGFVIYFEPSLAYHPSVMPKKYSKVFVPTLLDYGWDWGKSRSIYRFTYYEGYHFIEKAVEEFKRTTTLPITIQIESKYHPEYYNSLA